MKWCGGCRQDKLLSNFSKNRSRKDGWCSRCKECKAEDNREYRQSHKEEIALVNWSYRQSHQEGIAEQRQTPVRKELQSKSYKKYQEKYPEKIKASHAVNNAIRDGKLHRPLYCEGCNEEKFVQGHHWSYNEEYWLDVEWLCIKCHVEVHKSLKGEPHGVTCR